MTEVHTVRRYKLASGSLLISSDPLPPWHQVPPRVTRLPCPVPSVSRQETLKKAAAHTPQSIFHEISGSRIDASWHDSRSTGFGNGVRALVPNLLFGVGTVGLNLIYVFSALSAVGWLPPVRMVIQESLRGGGFGLTAHVLARRTTIGGEEGSSAEGEPCCMVKQSSCFGRLLWPS